MITDPVQLLAIGMCAGELSGQMLKADSPQEDRETAAAVLSDILGFWEGLPPDVRETYVKGGQRLQRAILRREAEKGPKQ